MNLTRANLVLAAAVAALAAPTIHLLLEERELFKDVSAIPRMFEGFDQQQVTTLLLGQPKPPAPPPPGTAPPEKQKVEYDQLTMVRTEKGYVLQNAGDLTGAPINTELLESQVWKHLADIRSDRETLVQADATDEQLAEHGLDDASAFVVQALGNQNQMLADLRVGKDASGGKYGTETVRGLFVRSGDSRDIVLYEVPYWQRQIKPELWLDKSIVRVTADRVRSIALRNASSDGRAIRFERPAGKTSWTCSEPPEGRAAVRQTEVDMLAQRFAYLAAQDFRMPLQRANQGELGLQQPTIEVTLVYEQDEAEKTLTMGIGNKVDGKDEHYLKTSASPFLLTIAKPFVTPLERDVDEFFDPAAPGAADPKDGKQDGEGKDGEGKDAGAKEPPK